MDFLFPGLGWYITTDGTVVRVDFLWIYNVVADKNRTEIISLKLISRLDYLPQDFIFARFQGVTVRH